MKAEPPFLTGPQLIPSRPGDRVQDKRTRGVIVIPLYHLNGRYYGFVVAGAYIFDAAGYYAGWVADGQVWRADGRYVGEVLDDRYVVRETFATMLTDRPPVPRPARPAPPVPWAPIPPRPPDPDTFDAVGDLDGPSP
jgi:hypothetical protein